MYSLEQGSHANEESFAAIQYEESRESDTTETSKSSSASSVSIECFSEHEEDLQTFEGSYGSCGEDDAVVPHATEEVMQDPIAADYISLNDSQLSTESATITSESSSSASDDTDSDEEFRKLVEFLSVAERISISQRGIRLLLKKRAVNSDRSYDEIAAPIRQKARTPRRYVPTCRQGHMAATGRFRHTTVYPLLECGGPVDRTRRFCYMRPFSHSSSHMRAERLTLP